MLVSARHQHESVTGVSATAFTDDFVPLSSLTLKVDQLFALPSALSHSDSLGWWLHRHFRHQFPVFAGCYLSAAHESGGLQVSSEFPCGLGCRDTEW